MIKIGTLIKTQNGYILEYNTGGRPKAYVASSEYELSGLLRSVLSEIEEDMKRMESKNQLAADPTDKEEEDVYDPF